MSKEIKKEVYDNLLSKYKSKIEEQLDNKPLDDQIQTKDYEDFKKEIKRPHLTLYEGLCNIAENYLKVKPDKKTKAKLDDALATIHLNATSTGVYSFGLFAPLVAGVFLAIILYLLLGSLAGVIIALLIAAIAIKPLTDLPTYMAQYWRLKASNQMVLCIFYVVTYMRHTSNLENAIQFASEHLGPPLSLDLKKVIWDVETERYESVKQSLDIYLNGWRKTNMEFVEAFHLVESSLFEGEETRRLGTLDKALDVILEETYEKMLHYAHHLKSPITMLHMLGIILPILGLVVMPLVVGFMPEIKWIQILLFYNILLPVSVYVIGRMILSKRPTGYGDTDISDENPELKKYKNILIPFGKYQIPINPMIVSIIIMGVFLLIGFSPIILHLINPAFDIALDGEYLEDSNFLLMGYIEMDDGSVQGPFGVGASVLSLFVTLAFGVGIGIFFKLRSKNVLKIRTRTKQLEEEFASALFQLGNRLGDNMPAEMAFGRVADFMQDTNAGRFFRIVSINIQKLGMSVSRAIFDPKQGAILSFPSKIIESSMKVLIESVKRGPRIAAQALTNVARYIKEIHRVNERLKDLMAEIISSMNSQIKFLTPAIAGIVVGITSMITAVLIKLTTQLGSMEGEFVDLNGLNLGAGLPVFHFQIIVGLYVVEICYILTILSNGIENGSDKLNEEYSLGSNLINGTILYSLISLAVMLIFNFIASTILSGALG